MFPLYDLNPHHRFPWLTVAIIVANAAVTLWMSGLNEDQADLIAFENGFVPIRASHMQSGKPVTLRIPEADPRGRLIGARVVRLSTSPAAVYPTFLTTLFLHGGWGHMLSNMWILWIFGNNIEDRLGHLMYLFYYLIGGVVATLCHWAVNPQSNLPVIGASGAVAAVLGGYALTYPWAMVRTLVFVLVLDIPALIWIGIWFITQNVIPVIQGAQGVVQEPVAYWAHIGGFLAGLVLMPVLSLGAPPPERDWRKEADEMFQFSDPRTRVE